MIILADKRIPEEAMRSLGKYGKILAVESDGITYPAISGHPDIFFCKAGEKLIVAPNAPKPIVDFLKAGENKMNIGQKEIGSVYPHTAPYNALITKDFVIHKKEITDSVILSVCHQQEFIDVKQAYTRCSTLALNENRFVTSDKGIEKVLSKKGFDVLYVNPAGIVLHGFTNGFFGGCCGVYKNKIFITGHLDYYPDGKKVKDFLSDYEIIELYKGPLYDGGGLIFLE